jgi:radical SAM superfamily enzyme YgiQ (UPF0313 family)
LNVLLVNPGYPETFWSFNRVLRMLGKRALLPPLGLLTVASLLPGNWDPRLVDMVARPLSEADWDHCDLLIVSGMAVQRAGILQVIREGKRRGKTVAVGGPWAFHYPEEALQAGADFVVKGEGELGIPLLLEALTSGRKGVLIEVCGRPELEDSPPPRYDLLSLRDYADMAVQFSRGCPFQCEFCDITHMFGRKVRTKAPSQVLRELDVLYGMGWRRAVFFVDDNFIGSVPRAKALLRELIPWMRDRGHPFDFYTQASVNLAEDAELLDLMVQAGFYRVFLGIETPDADCLSAARKFHNASADLALACERITCAGLQIIAGCIMGFDQEKPGADQRLIDFAVRNHIPEMFVTLLQAGPGTDLWNRLREEGRLLPDQHDEHLGSQTALMNFVPTRPAGQIVAEFIRLYQVLYDPASYLKRSFEHFSRMVPPPPPKRFALPSVSELRAVGITLLRQGVRYPSRREFWALLLAALVRFPSRFHHFLASCVTAEHYFDYRAVIKTQLRRKAALAQSPTPARPWKASSGSG